MVYDVANAAWLQAEALRDSAPESVHIAHSIRDIAQSGNRDVLSDALSGAYLSAREKLFPYTRESVPENVYHEYKAQQGYFKFHLLLPEGFSLTTAELVESLVHDYMVYYALRAYYLTLGFTSGAEIAGVVAAEASSRLQTALMSRTRRMRRPLKPF